ncbi:MAG: hypothetical protein ACXWDM_13745 [Nocardioides sp.]
MSDLFGLAGTTLLDRLTLPAPYAARIASLRRIMGDLDFEIDLFETLAWGRLRTDSGYVAVQQIPGIAPGRGSPGRQHRRGRGRPATSRVRLRRTTRRPRPRVAAPSPQAGAMNPAIPSSRSSGRSRVVQVMTPTGESPRGVVARSD